MVSNKFTNTLSEKTDNELIEIAQNRRGYSEEFLQEVDRILIERGYEINFTDESSIPNKEEFKTIEKDHHTYTPLVVGIGLLIIFFNIQVIFSLADRSSIPIIYMLVFGAHLGITIWSYHLSKKFKLSILLWPSLTLLFGPFSLILLNLAIWMKPIPKN